MDSFAFVNVVPLFYFYHFKNELLYNILIKPSLVVTLYVLDKHNKKHPEVWHFSRKIAFELTAS